MDYARIEAGQIVEGPGPLPDVWGNISGLPYLEPAELADLGWRPVVDEWDPVRAYQDRSAAVLVVEPDRVLRRWPAEPITLDVAQARLKARCDDIAREMRNAVVAGISPAEMASWPIKRAEAIAWQASGADSDAPSLSAEAAARQTTLADLVAKVIRKAAALSMLEAAISGRCGYLQDRIAAAASMDELDLIDINAGWPA